MEQEHSDFTWATIKVAIIWILSVVAHNYDKIAGNLLVTLSILYLIWKWQRDIKKAKKKDG